MTTGKRPCSNFLVTCVVTVLISPLYSQTTQNVTESTASSSSGSPTVTSGNQSTESSPTTTKKAPAGPCDEMMKDPTKYLLPHPIPEKRICYFIVNGSTAATSQKRNDSKFEFNIEAAREVCKKEKATLPILSSSDLPTHLTKLVAEVDEQKVDGLTDVLGVALGLKETGTLPDYAWDDGAKLEYSASKWNRNDTAQFTILPKEDANEWKNFQSNVTDKPVAVVCQLIPPRIIPCDSDDPVYELKTKSRKYCYFVVKDAIDRANTKDGEEYLFNKTTATDICKQYGAGLPIIDDYEENMFLMDTLSEQVKQNEKYKTTTIALGIDTTFQTGAIHEWVGPNPPRLDFGYQSEWPTKFVAGVYFSQMELDTGKWVSKTKDEKQKDPVLVVCQERYKNVSKPTVVPYSRCLWVDQGKRLHFSAQQAGNPRYPLAKVRDSHCFFTTVDAVDKVHKPLPNNTWRFDIGAARELCQSEDATLPRVTSTDEEQWIKDKIGSILTQQSQSLVIPLDIRQVRTETDYYFDTHTMYNGAKNPSDWHARDRYAYYTTMNLGTGTIEWNNVETAVRPDRMTVICEQENKEIPSLCSPDATPGYQLERQIFNNDRCYFVLKDRTIDVNYPVPNMTNHYYFQYALAAAVCREQKGTLPIIRNSEDHEFFLREFLNFIKAGPNQTGLIALGLLQTTKGPNYTHEWVNEGPFEYEAYWPNKFAAADYIVMELKYWPNGKPYIQWVNKKGAALDKLIYVICEQPHRGAKPTEPPKEQETENKCDQKTAGKFKIEHWRIFERTCYFVVPGASKDSNINVGTDQKQVTIFDFTHAQKVCRDYGATLPLLTTKEHLEFVLYNLSWKDMFGSELPSDAGGTIALDIFQVVNKTNYRWNDKEKTSVDASLADDWQNKGFYAYFVTAFVGPLSGNNSNDEGIIFLTEQDPEIDKPVGVLCQQTKPVPKPVATTEKGPEAKTKPPGATPGPAPKPGPGPGPGSGPAPGATPPAGQPGGDTTPQGDSATPSAIASIFLITFLVMAAKKGSIMITSEY